MMSHAEEMQMEYRRALDKMAFPEEAKRRFVNIMLDAPMPAPKVKRRPIGVLIAAAVCAMLTMSAAATAVWWHNQVKIVDSPQEAAMLEQGSGNAVALATYDGDYEYEPPAGIIAVWWDELKSDGAQETRGTEEDGWTASLTLREWGQVETRYLGSSLSSFDKVWDGKPLDTGWLEEHYTPVEGGQSCYTSFQGRKRQEFSMIGAYTGTDGEAFTLEYRWRSKVFGNSYMLSGGFEYAESYTTSDGVEVAVSMDKARSGDTLFWADLVSGHGSFHIHGTRMELEDVHELLDSLGLAGLCSDRE